jgi:hypothetical protein
MALIACGPSMALVPLANDEEEHLRTEGYLLVRSVLTQDEIATYLHEVDALVAQAVENGQTVREAIYHRNSYKVDRALRRSRVFDRLIDHPGYFGRIVSVMGPYIQLMGTEIFVRGSADETITGFHTDLGPGMRHMVCTDLTPWLEIKAQVFLTDLSTPDSSNFALIPRSHRRAAPEADELCMIDSLNRQLGPRGELPRDALQVLASPGDVLIFPHTLWHSVAPNRSGRTRYSIAFRYGQLALRPLERFDPVLTDPTRDLTPRQRRLLGDLGDHQPSPYRPLQQESLILGG